MRAIFTVDILPNDAQEFPSNEDFLLQIRANIWEDIRVKELSVSEKFDLYMKVASELVADLPEIVYPDKESVIFYGALQENQTRFVITRITEGQATFRLSNANLSRLIQSVEKLVGWLVATPSKGRTLDISNDRILVFDKDSTNALVSGRVIADPLTESIRVDLRNLLLAIVSSLLLTITLIGIFLVPDFPIVLGTFERLSTALVITIIISSLSFFQTYYGIRTAGVIVWSFSTYSESIIQ